MAKACKEDGHTPWGEHISTRPTPWKLGKPRRFFSVRTEAGDEMLGLDKDEWRTVSGTSVPITPVEGKIRVRPTLPGRPKAQEDANKIVALVPGHASGFLIGRGHNRSSFESFVVDGLSK